MKDTELASDKKGSTGFFASAEGASFSANSFVELNLSRPLLRACESLGYKKPTPIQVLHFITCFCFVSYFCVYVRVLIHWLLLHPEIF